MDRIVARLALSIAFVAISFPFGAITASADGPTITKVLVTQVLGDQDGRYVAGKDAVVRVLLSAEALPDAATQSVVVKRGGTAVTTLKPSASTTATSALVFACPTSAACGGWQAGDYTFEVTVGASKQTASAKFQDRGVLNILAVNITANYGGEIKKADDRWKKEADFTRRVFPLAPENLKWNIGADLDLTEPKFDLRTETGDGEVLAYLRQLIPAECKQRPRPAGLTCYDAVVGFVPDVIGKAPKEALGVASAPTALVSLSTRDSQATVAHEIAHHFKVSDEYASGKMGTFWCYNNQPPSSFIGRNGDTDEEGYSCKDSKEVPHPTADGILVRADAEHPYEIGGRGALPDFTTYMGTGAQMHEQWTSKAIWRVLFDAFDPAKMAASSVEAQAAPSRFIAISGTVDQKDGVELFPAGTFMSTNTHTDTTSTWTARALDSTGRVLATTGFRVRFDAPAPGVLASQAPIDAVLPFPATVARFEILKGTAVKASITPSRNAPTVSITAPAANESVKDGQYTIRWTAADTDGDKLTATVEYSIDGKEWIPIAAELTTTSFSEDFSFLAGTGKADSRVRVTVSDGVHSASATSGLFTVQPKAPFADIEFPAPYDEFQAGEEVYLVGYALDVKDDYVAEDGLVWTSSLQGQLGKGEVVARGDLRQGEHKMTLTATNSLGLKDSWTVTVAIHPAGRKVTLADVYAVYGIYLRREPVFGVETPGWIGKDFGWFVSEVRWSEEALDLADTGYVPTKSAFTGLAIKR